MSKQVILDISEGIGILSVNRPEVMNALNEAITREISAMLDQLASDRQLRVLIIYGKENFAAGADVGEFIDFKPDQVRSSGLLAATEKLQKLPIPTIAAIEGFALGGGLELALACDFRIASEDAQMGLPEINLGIIPGAGGPVRLVRLIGESRAKEMIFTGRNVTAEKAYEMGLVNEVTEKGAALDRAAELAKRLIKKSAPALRTAKEAIAAGQEITDVYQAVAAAASLFSALMGTKDQMEGMRAFMEKRKPVFSGSR